MNRSQTPLPLRRLAWWAFVLNTVWKFGQCVFLFDMWDWPLWKATLYMWAALALDLWSYSALMPTVQVAGHPVGLSPLVQVTTLPAFGAWLAGRSFR